MTILESIKVVREAAGLVEGQVPYINEVVADDWNAMLAALTAAESAAAAQDTDYQRAREAWDNSGIANWPTDEKILDEYFKGGE